MSEEKKDEAVTGEVAAEENQEEGAEEKKEESAPVVEEKKPEPEIPKPKQKILTKEMCSEGLRQVEMIADGSTYAYIDLNLEGQAIDVLGEPFQNYDYLRVINLNNNNLKNIDRVRGFKYLQKLEAKDNKIDDNPFLSESKLQLKFLTTVDMSGNQLTAIRHMHCVKLRSMIVDNNLINKCELRQHDSLFHISANKNKLENLEGFTNLKCLQNLSLAENVITSLKGINNYPKLEILDL